MPRVCVICTSGLAPAAEKLVGEGRSMRSVAANLGLSYDALKRHMQHVARRVQQAPAPSRATSRPSRGTGASTPAAPVPDDPCETFELAFGSPPMDHQREYLTETADTCFLKGRQVGATQAAAGLAIHVARSAPGKLAAIISPSMKQSTEVTQRARVGLWDLGERLVQDSTSLIRLENGSRILSLPGTARAVRGYSADLLILDEAAWITDETWTAARPITSATRGRTIVQSTPGVPVGWFWELTRDVPEGWHEMRVTSEQAPTVDPEFLAREKARLDPHLYLQEYAGVFASVGSSARWFPEDEYDAKVNKKFGAWGAEEG
ncbi:MAG: hypothetical protein C0498_01680 [Anaerolinea sp.]|nr:hypothetical protein [Anaerolinea sp.]